VSGRIRHLDALRAFAMLFGLFVHAEGLFATPPFPLVYLVSTHFRMAAFFLVSGFFASLMAARTSQGAMVRCRTLALMLPFCAVLAFVHPVTLWLVRVRNDGAVPFAEFLSSEWVPTQLLHLWFLPALWAYVLLEPLLASVLGIPASRRLARDAASWRPDALICALAAGIGLATAALIGLAPLISRITGGTQDWMVQETLRYLPFFALGVALRITPALFDRFHRVSAPALMAGIALSLVVDGPGSGLPSGALTAMETFTRAALTLPVVAALLWICRALFSGPSGIVGALTESIYTVYLFHYLALFAAALLLAPVLESDAALYFACVVSAFLTTFALHRLIIARAPLLRLIFNGRPPPARVTEA